MQEQLELREPAKAETPWYGMNWIRRDKRLAIHIRDKFECMYCFKDLRDAEPGELHLDHLLPRSCGGSNDQANLVTACKSCNCTRHDMPVQAFIQDYIYGESASDREAETATHWHMGVIADHLVRPLNRELAKSLLRGGLRDWLASFSS